MSRFKEYSPNQQLLLPPRLDELIDPDDTVRVVSSVVEKVDRELLYSPFPSVKGEPPYHPVMMMKLLIYGYARLMNSKRVCSMKRIKKWRACLVI